MNTNRQSSNERALLGVLEGVHRRWRLRTVVRGLAFVAGAAVLILLLGGVLLDRLQFSPGAVVVFRWLGYGTLAAVAIRFLVVPLMRRPTSTEIALYLEEHEPSLNARVLSALEVVDASAERPSDAAADGALQRAVVEQAIEACRSVEDGLRIERTTLRRSWGILVAAFIVTAIALAVGPRSLRYGATALALPTRSADDVSPYAMDVVPGDITVARSSDQSVRARSVGFEAETIELLMRPVGMGEEYQRLPMFPDQDGMHEVLLLDLREDVEYFVRSGRVRSPVYTIRVEDLPYAENIEVEYVFPEYTGLEPLVEEDGGDIAALTGTTVNLRITPTIPSPGGQMVVVTGDDGSEDATEFDLTADGTGDLRVSFRVREDGRYSIRLSTGDERLVDASPDYFIDALADQPPTLQFTEPGRDESATAIEEVFLETRVQDDYGVGPVDLLFSINGGDEETVRLGGAGSPGLRDATSSYTLYLEEYELEPGDLVAYHARTEDPGTGVEVESDLYFIQIRPFRTDVRQAEGGGAGGGGEGGGAESALAERQRQITVGTFNLIRDRENRSPSEIAEDVATLAQAQTDLRAETQAVAARAGGAAGAAPGGASIATLLREAAGAMGQAIEALEAESPDSALGPEQVALQKLQAATEALSEMQVSTGGQGGGGGGGAGQALDELDLDSSEMRNQYESVRRGQQEQVDQEIDETLERLKELARRQEQEAERQRRMGEGAGSSASGERQRAMADEAEEAARQLERLSRDSGNPEIMESARRLREAAESMRRSAAGQGTGGSEATSAADQLEEAQRQLERARGERLQEAGEEALRQIEDLQRRQERMGSEVDGLDELSSAGQREERTRRLLDQKGAMGEEIQDLETTLDRLAAQGREEQPQAARAFEEAAEGIRDDRLSDKVQYSQGLIRDGRDAEAARFEDEIGQDLERLRDRVEAAVGAFESPREDRLDQAASEARRLVQGLEAMERRGREGDPGDGADPGQQGQAGQDGGQGEESRTGQQGQAGQQGQTGGQPGAPGVGRPGVGEGQANRALTPDEIRQMRGEARQRAAQARDLRDRLEAEGFEAEALDGLVENLQRLESAQAYDDREALTRLQQEVLQDARRFEYALRRAMQRDGEGPPSLSGNEDVPSSYRALVEEYFRALSESAREGRPPGGDPPSGGQR
jgi:hypothetical protein